MKRITLETFVALAHLRHFGKVASQLNTTQSTVSARIAGLESDLGAELFARTSNSVALTPKGRELLTHATEVIASMDRMSRAVGLDPYREGTLRLGVSETLASTILPGFIGAYSQQYPNSSVEIIVNNTAFQRDQLVERGLDLALLMGPISHALIANVPLLELPMIWAVAPDHPLAATDVVTVEALAAFPILSYAMNSRPYIELVESLRLAGVQTPRLFSSNALGASVAIAEAKLAVCTAPQIYAAPYIEAGKLVEITTPIVLNPLSFTASYRTEPGNDLAQEAAGIAAMIAQDWKSLRS
ncbi:LysR family transcriptional regulator [uncultured Tateyamaria sp.]|uniref:LysR family transcriptional regulator n=1 Tax=uncultured Tateyamaria sp. TaxID=455651 RepID=UPI002624B89C|nr:LysR family transcriptional regulator [uncultured Tateyamaria sp.]